MVKRMVVLTAGLAMGLFVVSSSVQAADDPARTDQNRDNSANVSSGNLNSHDAGFLDAISRGDVAEIKLAKLAEKQSNNDAVKNFAKTIVKDHQDAQNKLKTLAKDKNLSVPTDVNDKQQAEYDRLEKLNGADFDKAYIKEMIDDHEHDVDLTKDFSNHAQDSDVKSFANQILPTLEKHLTMAKDANNQLGGAGSSNR